MSNLSVKEINHPDGDTNEVQIPSLDKRLVKAWLSYNGSTNTINDSYNVSSVTDNGAGQYTVNFETALDDANYMCANNFSVSATESGNGHINCNNKSTSSFSIEIETSSGTQEDAVVVDVMVLGD